MSDDSNPSTVSRRRYVQTLTGAGAFLAAGGVAPEIRAADAGAPSRKDFYRDKVFDQARAKAAAFEMMERFGYPISERLRTDDLWVCDFLQEDHEKLGMAGILWTNASGIYGKSGAAVYSGEFKDREFGYLGHEIFLLPGQMLPEHRHIGGPEGHGPKMESWHVRYGEVQFFGEHKGAGDEIPISDLPANERPWGFGEDWFQSKYVVKRTAASGQMYSLEDPESWHCQRAGSKGAIVSEYATYHNNVEFSKPLMAFGSTGIK